MCSLLRSHGTLQASTVSTLRRINLRLECHYLREGGEQYRMLLSTHIRLMNGYWILERTGKMCSLLRSHGTLQASTVSTLRRINLRLECHYSVVPMGGEQYRTSHSTHTRLMNGYWFLEHTGKMCSLLRSHGTPKASTVSTLRRINLRLECHYLRCLQG
jgi:uncharacterized membrane protein YjjP (DUF1212 family)